MSHNWSKNNANRPIMSKHAIYIHYLMNIAPKLGRLSSGFLSTFANSAHCKSESLRRASRSQLETATVPSRGCRRLPSWQPQLPTNRMGLGVRECNSDHCRSTRTTKRSVAKVAIKAGIGRQHYVWPSAIPASK